MSIYQKLKDTVQYYSFIGKLNKLFLVLVLVYVSASSLLAQNNLQVNYASPTDVPHFINICGNADNVKITVATDGFSTSTRTEIEMVIQFFTGVSLVEFDVENSTTGVVLTNDSNPNQPLFSLPDLNPTELNQVTLSFSIKADCAYTDTLYNNNEIQVFDTYQFTYNISNQESVTETDFTAEYRDAFAVPFFTTEITNPNSVVRVGQCIERTLTTTNSGLNGMVENMTYTNTQAAGVYVEEISVNNQVIPFTKTVLPTGDTLITANIFGDLFQTNDNGNTDAVFDPDESFILKEKICINSCFEGAFSTHKFSWGCEDRYCTEVIDVDFITFGDGAANIEIALNENANNSFAGYCQTGQQTVTFFNNGFEIDEGYGIMRDIRAGIGLSGNLFLNSQNYNITAIYIAGVLFETDNAFIDLNNHPLLANDPDGEGGLIDGDGDGFYDDLAVNTGFDITIEYNFDCTNANSTEDVIGNCTNDFTTNLSGRIAWTDNCGELITRYLNSFELPANNNSNIENTTVSDAYAEEDIFIIEHKESRTVRDFAVNCSDAQFVARVVLPTGVNPVIGQTKLLINEFLEVPLISNSIANDTSILVFNAANNLILNANYTLQLAFQATCDAPVGATSFPLEFEFACGDCACNHVWYCGNLAGPQLHNRMPPCDETQITNCEEGLQTTSFQVNRANFGYTDATFQAPINPNDANTKVALSCDLVEMEVKSISGATAITDNIGLQINYDNPNATGDESDVFTFLSGELTFIKNNVVQTFEVSNDQLTVTTQGVSKTLTFDFDNDLQEWNNTLIEGDSINFKGTFSVNPDGPYTTQFKNVPNLRAEAFAIINGEKKACDNFGDNFTVAKTQTGFDFPNNNDFPIGCATQLLEYRLITVNNGYSQYFGQEYRPAISVDSLVFDFDTNIIDAFGDGTIDVSFPDHPIYGNDFYNIAPLSDFPDGHYTALFDTLDFSPSLNVVQGYAFNLRIKLTPTCTSAIGSQEGNGIYEISPSIYYKDRLYSAANTAENCAQEVTETVTSTIQYTTPPELNITPESASNFILTGDTATWIVQVCNTSTEADATVVWLGAEDFSGVATIVTMEDVTNSNNIIDLMSTTYGTNNTFAFADIGMLRKADGLNSDEEICRKIRIKAIPQNCENTNINLRTGYSCQALEENWSPDDNTACTESNLQLSVTLRQPFLEAEISEQNTDPIDVCSTQSMSILLRNNDQGAAFDVITNILLPINGTALVPNSFEIAYPNNADFVAIPDPVLVNSDINGLHYQYSDFSSWNAFLDENGLIGFNPEMPNDSNEIVLRFNFTTDCNFKSSDLIRYNFQGKKSCGENTNYEAGESLPFVINGVDNATAQTYDINFAPNSELTSGSISTIQVDVQNISTQLSSAADLISITLPEGISYVVNTSNALLPNTWTLSEPNINEENGLQTIQWNIPEGLTQNETASFTFDLNANALDCSNNTLEIALMTLSQHQVLCTETNEACTVDAITSTNGGTLQTMPINGTILLNYQSVTAACSTTDQEQINVIGELQATGGSFNNQIFNIRIYADANGNMLVDEGEELVHSININSSVTADAPLPFTATITTSTENSCQLISIIELEENNACASSNITALPPVTLDNAGENQIFCFEGMPYTAQLGIDCVNDNYTYNWTAIPPASTEDLSATNIAQPTVTINTNTTETTTYRYVLTTIRGNCAPAFDTIEIIKNSIPVISQSEVIIIAQNETVTLNPTVNGGLEPYAFAWSPNIFLNDTSSQNPIATPTENISYTLTVTDAIGCQSSETFTINIDENGGSDCPIFPNVDSTVIQINCDSSAVYCLNLPFENATNYSITDNGLAANFITCDTNMLSAAIELPIGAHELIVAENETACADTIITQVVCTQPDTQIININLYQDSLICFDTDELLTVVDSFTNLCPDGQFVEYEGINATCLEITGTSVGSENACLVLCDTLGICDTTYLTINVHSNNSPPIQDTIIVTQTGTICMDTVITTLSDGFSSITNICPEGANGIINFELNEATYCVNYEGMALGTGNACIEVCDSLNNCDTLDISITVVPGTFYYDTMFIHAPQDTFCLDTEGLGTIVNMSDLCSDLNGENVDFSILDNTYCVVYTPISDGIDTACIRLEDEMGNISLTNMVITVVETTPQYIVDTLYIAESDTACLDLSELLADIDFIDDACADSSTGNVDFFLNPVTNCIEYTGVELGKDTACWYTCDSIGICDTTYFCILVEEYFAPPIANPDIDTTNRGTPVVLNVKENDIFFGGLTSSAVVVQPLYGAAIMNPDCSITYLPDPKYCEREDEFSYEICTENGCSITTVTIYINCLDVRVFNVVSPNNDGINDEFWISNILGKSGKLEIYNRWGNLVYESDDYQNNWPGSYNTEKDLPDGTYYYLLNWSDPDTGEEFFQRGFVELKR